MPREYELTSGLINNYRPMRALQLMKWDGKTWVRFGDVIEGMQS